MANEADAIRLYALDVGVDPLVNGADNVQAALTALGAASVFPVGPKVDGANTYEVSGASNSLGVVESFTGTDGQASVTLTNTTKDAATADLFAKADAGPSALIEASTTAAHGRGHIDTNGATMIDAIDATLGFYGVTPVVRAAHPVLLADVIAILTNPGLCN